MEFRHEFEAERGRWLKRRFVWFGCVMAAWQTIAILYYSGRFALRYSDAGLSLPLPEVLGFAGLVATAAILVILYAGPVVYVHRTTLSRSREDVLRLVFWIFVTQGIVTAIGKLLFPLALGGAMNAGPLGFLPQWGFTLFMTHVVAASFMPWTPREAIRPLAPLLVIFVVAALFVGAGGWLPRIFAIVLSPAIALPGLMICQWRHGRFRDRFQMRMLRGRYKEMRQELTDARRIHESLFPEPISEGAVRFEFEYEPMRQIGGDFLFTHRFPGIGMEELGEEPLSIVIIDVTGHGIPAALTVNRLHGELERIFAEEPDISPGDVLTALNRYVHLTLATHSVYATALCLRVAPELNILEWANGGHPPAFVRTIDGRLDQLDSTAFVLGACHGDDFDPHQRSMQFTRGDSLIAYTDGATEARSETGSMMRVEGMRSLVATSYPSKAPARGGWAGEIARRVWDFRFGPATDDMLIVEVYRPVQA